MYTLDQLTNATLDQVKSDPALLKAFTKLYFGAGATEANETQLLRLWTSQDRNFNSDKDYVIKQLNVSDGSELARSVDRYINWNNTAKPEDLTAANKEREKAMVALDEKAQQLAKIGIDIKSIPQYATFYTQLGGQTSAQTAKDLGQTTVNLPDVPVNTASDTQGASVGTYKPATSGGSSVGTYQPNSDNLPSSIAPITNNQYVYDSGHLGSKANDAAVNQLYNSYFGRNATAAELANWGNKGNSTVQQVEDFLQAERAKYNYTAPVKSLTGEIITTNTPAQTSVVSNIPFKAGLNDAQKQSIIDLTSKPVASWSQTDKDNWNYATNNTAIPGLTTTTPTASTPTNSSIPFKSGLSDAQKASITALTNKPSAEWTQTDKDNWNYATNNAPIPGGATGNSDKPTTPTGSGKRIYRIGNDIYDADTGLKIPDVATLTRDYAGATEVPAPANGGAGANNSGQQTGVGVYQQNQANAAAEAVKNGTGSPAGTTSEISAEDKKWINDLYQKYFDRTATSAEIANWASSTPAALDQFLVSEQKKYGYVSNAQKAVQSDKLKAALAIIDASNLPDEIKALWRQTVSLYPDATDFQPQQIIDTFNKIKTETVDPYFKELTDLAVGDVKTAFNQLKDARTSELESERYNSADAIRQARAGLEKSGMTFTGKGIEQLGASSAYAQNADGVATPSQIGFAGMPGVFYEGNVNQANRLLSTSTAARYAAQQQTLGRAAENQLGSGAVAINLPGLQYTPGNVNVTGSLEQQKQGKMASTLQGIIENWKTSQNLKTNI